ncbi:MAG: hypothetical protein FWG44_06645 [Oscillospiraceae bacterium]|nr:hypothetical protein [Oscillospiraceae bacterium]
MNAELFLQEIKKLNFSGRDFLEIIGNSKINNNVYNEIKKNTGLTYERLVRLLDNSGLTSGDYTRILNDARVLAKMRAQKIAEMNRREDSVARLGNALVEAQKRQEQQERLRAEKAAQIEKSALLLAQAESKKQAEAAPKTETASKTEQQLVFEERQTSELYEELFEEITETEPDITNEIPEINPSNNNRTIQIEPKQPKQTELSEAFKIQIHDDFSEEDDETEIVDEEALDSENGNNINNKGKLILCFVMAFMVISASFTVRYFQTGSFWLEKEQEIVFTVPETYKELANRLTEAAHQVPLRTEPDINYRLASDIRYSGDEKTPKTIVYNERTIFNIIENKLFAVEARSGNMLKTAEIEFENQIMREMYIHQDRLYLILEGEYAGSYHHVGEVPENDESDDYNEEEILPEIISGEFTQKFITVVIFDAWDFSETPLLSFTVSGEYQSAFFHKNKFVIATGYIPHEPKAYSDLSAFVPLYSVNDESRQFIPINHIYAPPAPLMNTGMTVLGVIEDLNVQIYAAAGGIGHVSIGEKSLLITQVYENFSRLIKLDITGETEPKYFDVNGVIPDGGVNEGGGLVRVGFFGAKGGTLYVMNEDLELLSSAVEIGKSAEETDFTAGSVLFDYNHVYFIIHKVYIFDTTIAESIAALTEEEQAEQIYTDDFYRISDKERLEIAVETDADGKRAGIRLNIHEYEQQGEEYTKITATYLITAESSVNGNWNPYLFTDAETARDAVFIASPEASDSVKMATFIIPVKYHNSISSIEKIIVLDYNEFTGMTKRSEIVYYDINKERRRAVIIGEYIYSFWDTFAVSARGKDGVVVEKLELTQ